MIPRKAKILFDVVECTVVKMAPPNLTLARVDQKARRAKKNRRAKNSPNPARLRLAYGP